MNTSSQTPDGQPTPPDSADSTPQTSLAARGMEVMAESIASDADNSTLVKKWADLTPAENEEAKQAMQWLGVTAKRARMILKAYGGGKYLRRGIAGALAWNFELSALEEAQRALAWCRKMYKDKNIGVRERIECVKASGSILANIARLCDSSISAAEKFEKGENPNAAADEPKEKSVTVGVNINNFPPVAQVPSRANGGLLDESRRS